MTYNPYVELASSCSECSDAAFVMTGIYRLYGILPATQHSMVSLVRYRPRITHIYINVVGMTARGGTCSTHLRTFCPSLGLSSQSQTP